MKKQKENRLTVEQKKTSDKCSNIAKDILKMIANYDNLTIGQYNQHEFNEAYKDLIQEIKKYLLTKNVLLEEIKLINQYLEQPTLQINHILNENLNNSLRQAQEKLWKKSPEDITYNDLDNILK